MRPGSSDSVARRGLRLVPLAAALPGGIAIFVAWSGLFRLERPVGLWAFAALLPLALLHLFVPERSPVRVAALALWSAVFVAPDAPPRLRPYPFYRETAFWLRASMVALIACALASPKLQLHGRDPALLLLIDRSATLAARDRRGDASVSTTREQRVLALARRMATDSDVPVGLVVQSADVRVQLSPGSARPVVRALDQIEAGASAAPPSGWSGLFELLGTAGRLRDAYGGDLRIVLISDNVDGRAERALLDGPLRASCDAGWCTLKLVDDPAPLSDVSLLAAPAQVTVGLPFTLQILNSGSTVAPRRLRFEQSGQPATFQELTLRPGRSTQKVQLGRAGCWTLRLESEPGAADALSTGKELVVQAEKTTGMTCLVGATEDAGAVLGRFMVEQGLAVLGTEVLPYESRTLAALHACTQVVLIDPLEHREFLLQPELRSLDWLAIYPQPPRGRLEAVVSRISADVPPLRELEPRLLPLSSLRDLVLPAQAQELVSVLEGTREGAAVVRYMDGPRQRVLVGVRGDEVSADQQAALRELLLLLAVYRDRDGIDAIAPQVTDRLPSAAKFQRLCSDQPMSPRRSEPGLYADVPQSANRVRVTALDPNLRSIRPLRPTPLAVRPSQGPRQAPLWPYLLALAFVCALLEQSRRRDSSR